MSKPVSISVIVPIYGVEKFIARFADSLLSQDYPHIQFIFVNDETKDGSMLVLNNLIEQCYFHLKERIVIVNKKNEGCPKARRTGLSHATGDYVVHADPDDWFAEGAFTKIAAVAQQTQADLLYFDYYKEYEAKGKTKYISERLYTIEKKDDYIRDMYNHRTCGSVWNKCVKRSVYMENPVYYPQTPSAEDVCLMTQLVGYSSSLVHIQSPLYHYRRDNPGSVSKRNPKFRRYRAVVKFLDMYEFYNNMPQDNVPIRSIYEDIVMKAGWSSIMHRFDLFTERPYLAKDIRKASISSRRETPVFAQIITKIYSIFA